MSRYEIHNVDTDYTMVLNCNTETAFKTFCDICRLMGYSEVKAELSVAFAGGSMLKVGPFVIFSESDFRD